MRDTRVLFVNAPVIAQSIFPELDKIAAEVRCAMREFADWNRSNLFYEIWEKDVAKQIIQYINNRKGESGIVYCLSRKSGEDIQ